MSQRKEITIHDIAKKLSISASTVSRALNNNPIISESTRKRIKRTAEKMGYRPNNLAASLRTRRTHTIGVIVPLINRHFFSSVISGIEEVAYNEGFTVTISQSNDSLEKESKIAQSLYNNHMDGIIISIGMETENYDHLKHFKEKNIPIVFFDRALDEIEAHKIVVDDYGGGYRVTKHLLDQGANRIAHIGGPLTLGIYRLRQKGYNDALKHAGIKIDKSIIVNNNLTSDDGTAAIKKLLKNPSPPDAIFCANDTTALSVIIYLHNLGIKVPDDIAVIGFSNEPYSAVVTPSISTVRQPGFEMGKQAARLLIEQIKSKSTRDFRTIVMPTELIIRQSSNRKAKT